MWRKRILGLTLSGVLLFGTVPAYAKDISVSDGTTTESVTSNFSVTADMLGGGLTVTIPSGLDLTYDTDSQSFKASENVLVSGTVEDGKTLQIQAEPTITYENKEDSSVTVKGKVIFGKSGVVTCTGANLSVSEPVNIEVPLSNITVAGDYSSVINFNISMEE